MSTHDKARRAFLIQTATGMGAAAAGVLPVAEAQAETKSQPATMAMPMPKASGQSHGLGLGAFFNAGDAQTIAAIAERIFPGAPGKPGATDAGVLNYIDLALAGPYADQQEFYRQGLAQLDAYCNAAHKKSFVSLTAAEQDAVLTALEHNKATGFDWPHAQPFFNALRKHTMEGLFADPVYGGNKDMIGWRLVGFPGAQEQYIPDDMHSDKQFTREAMIGLQS